MNTYMRSLAETGLATTVTAVVGSLGTDTSSKWYKKLDKPDWQPAPEVFPIAWTTLYGLIAHSSARTLADLKDEGDKKKVRRFRTALGINLTLNAAWCHLFFQSKNTKAATVGAVALAISSCDLARRARKVRTSSGLLLLPYSAWTAFAAALSSEIDLRNS